MQCLRSGPRPGIFLRHLCVAALAALLASVQIAAADETGVSFWIPGQFGSLAAVPPMPGWSMGRSTITRRQRSGNVAAAKEIQIGRFPATVNVNLNANLNSQGDLFFLAPTYTFATPVLGGQFAVSMTGIFGQVNTSIAGTLTAASGATAWALFPTRSRELATSIR